MPINLLKILTTPVEWGVKVFLKKKVEKYALRRASDKAKYEDLTGQTSLLNLVKIELDRVAEGDQLPPAFRSAEFRNWLRHNENAEAFVRVMIARSGNIPGLPNSEEDQLASECECITGKTGTEAAGLVKWVVSHVYGQLSATESGKQALHEALELWTAAQIQWLSRPEQQQFPSEADLARVKAMAATLLEAGKRSWKMPRFVAPLALEAHVRQDSHERHPTTAPELSLAIEAGDSLVIFGAGGIGKTTFLLDMCASCINSGHRIPLYVDAAVWARTNKSLFEYITSQPSAQGNGVTSAELTKLAMSGRLVIMLNGWNEMEATSKLVCRDGLIQLIAAAEALNVVVVSRSSCDTPTLPEVKQIEVSGLTWQGQSAVIRAELGDAGGAPLLDLLARDSRLRHAAKSPLILRGLVAQASKGTVASSNVFDLLSAAVQAFEEDDQHHHMLSVAPVDGHQRAYLEELACLLTERLATNCTRDSALQAIHSAATRLAEDHLIGAPPSLSAILDALVSHHLLHLDDGMVRFAHQRFQEYFAATRLLRECIEEDVLPQGLLRTVVNQPAWDEALALVADKLKGEGGTAIARTRLVKTAAAIDLGLACDLAGICALSVVDDVELHHDLVACVNALATSHLMEVRDLCIAYQIASSLPAFAERLWPLLESEDQQTRIHINRLNGSGISLAQLGLGADKRLATWSSDRRVEFVYEIANNADNYEFLVGLALSEPDPAVRAAAISALFWEFPASDVPLQAWLSAPVEVLTEHNVLSDIQHALKEGYAADTVYERLKIIAIDHASNNALLALALTFPDEVGSRALDVVFEKLRSSERQGYAAPLVAIARTNAPERLLDLARELALEAHAMPDWVREYLHEAPVDVRTDVFEQAWATLQGPAFGHIRGEVFGPLADRNQIERTVASLLQYAESGREALSDIDRQRHWQLEDLLAHAPGGDLLNVVMQRGPTASYNEAAQLVGQVLRRIGLDDGSPRKSKQWLPTVDEVQQLISVFAEKVEAAEVPQDTIRVYLCSIASQISPAQFGPILLETCRRHLDAWGSFQEILSQWQKNGASPRPSNPQLGLYLASAMAKWGPDSLPGLLELITHPNAMKFVPEAIARIVSLPWASKRQQPFNGSTDIQEGERRRSLGRELRQPEDAYQGWTDAAAQVLGQKLADLVTAYQEKKATGEKWNARDAEYNVGRLARVVASIPSAGVVERVHHALASGLMDAAGIVGALRGLVRQGLFISDTAVVRQLEALYEHEASTEWHDSSRYAMAALSELLFCVVSTSLLSKPIGQYLQQWRRFSHPNEIIHHLGAMHSEVAWSALIEQGRILSEEGRPPETLISALVSGLTQPHLPEFLELVASGTLFEWCDSEFTLERLAPGIAVIVREGTGQVEAFLDACRRVQSPLADALAGNVLSHIKGSEEASQKYMLEALDAGRAIHTTMPAYRMLMEMFKLREPIGEAQFEVTPIACNGIRMQLYARAKSSGAIADGCRRLLASLECQRRETKRPDDEPRHPKPEDGLAWTDSLFV